MWLFSWKVPSRISNKTLPTTPKKPNGNVRQAQSKTKKTVISPSSNDSSYSSTTMDEKNNNLVSKTKPNTTSPIKKERRSSSDYEDVQSNNIKKEYPIGKIVFYSLKITDTRKYTLSFFIDKRIVSGFLLIVSRSNSLWLRADDKGIIYYKIIVKIFRVMCKVC